jgi:hypothetical protein
LNGRDWASLATLSPGVNAIETQMPFENGALRGNRGFGSQLTISGGRPKSPCADAFHSPISFENYRAFCTALAIYAGGAPQFAAGRSRLSLIILRHRLHGAVVRVLYRFEDERHPVGIRPKHYIQLSAKAHVRVVFFNLQNMASTSLSSFASH